MVAAGNVILFVRNPHVDFVILARRAGLPESAPPAVVGTVGTDTVDVTFFYFIFATILLFNVLYVALLHRARMQRAAAT